VSFAGILYCMGWEEIKEMLFDRESFYQRQNGFNQAMTMAEALARK